MYNILVLNIWNSNMLEVDKIWILKTFRHWCSKMNELESLLLKCIVSSNLNSHFWKVMILDMVVKRHSANHFPPYIIDYGKLSWKSKKIIVTVLHTHRHIFNYMYLNENTFIIKSIPNNAIIINPHLYSFFHISQFC